MTTSGTTEGEEDPEATARLPAPQIDGELQDIDPERTIVREDLVGAPSASDWESTVIRRVAARVAEVREQVEQGDEPFGWESDSLRRLSRALK